MPSSDSEESMDAIEEGLEPKEVIGFGEEKVVKIGEEIAETTGKDSIPASANKVFELQHAAATDMSAVEYLDLTADDEDEPVSVPVGLTIKALIKLAKRHQSFSALFTLHAVKTYLELLERFRRVPNIKNPVHRASLAVAKSAGKGPYFARKVVQTVVYTGRFRTLPPNSSGKHHAHPSLLNNERIHQAVRRFLTIQPVGEVSCVSISNILKK